MPWSPKNAYLWDFWFARRDDELHVFYLRADCRAAQWNADRRHDLASVGHAVMTPAGWQEVGAALSKAEGKNWDNLSIWTGCVIQNPDDGLYYLFYTARSNEDAPVWTPSEWQRRQQIGLAVSPDLMQWERAASHPVIGNPGRITGLDGVAWRDPYVVRDEDGTWRAFICARLNPESKDNRTEFDAGGAVVYLESKDLKEWDSMRLKYLAASQDFYQMEAPQVFWRNFAGGKRFYLLFCAQEKDCSRQRRARLPREECGTGTYYLRSDLLPHDYRGVPKLNEPARLLAPGWYAGRLLDPETAETPFFFGFQWADEAGRFVGGISDPMPARFGEDGAIELMFITTRGG